MLALVWILLAFAMYLFRNVPGQQLPDDNSRMIIAGALLLATYNLFRFGLAFMKGRRPRVSNEPVEPPPAPRVEE